MQNRKAWGYLGLAARAGKAVSGSFCVERSVRARRARLVIVSEEASQNTQKTFRDLCTYYKIPLYVRGSSEELGKALGKDFRMVAAIEDEGLAEAAAGQLEQESGIGGSMFGEQAYPRV